MKKPLVSVCMITYNHEPYIAQAIESVAQQKTNFPFELIIGEDCSTDHTREICNKYQEKYPQLIRLHLHEQNVGVMRNFNTSLNACNGKYVALLEGDDYWTDPHKLQKQVDFLEEHPEYIGCAHRVTVIGLKDSHMGIKRDRTYEMKDLLSHRPFHTASLLINKDITGPYDFPATITSGDRALYIQCASHGPFYYSAECMAVYRKHEGGLSMNVRYGDMLNDVKLANWAADKFQGFPRYEYLSFVYSTVLLYSHGLTRWQRIAARAGFFRYRLLSYLPWNRR